MFYTTETEARAALEISGGYIWPFFDNGQKFQIIDCDLLLDLLAGWEGDGRAVAERAIMGSPAERAGLNSETPPVIWGHVVSQLLRDAKSELAAEPAEGPPTEAASAFMARVEAASGVRWRDLLKDKNAERVWDGMIAARRGDVRLVTTLDPDGIDHALDGSPMWFLVEGTPGAFDALEWEAAKAEPALVAVADLAQSIRSQGDAATPGSVMMAWHTLGGVEAFAPIMGKEEVGGPANGGRWWCPKLPLVVEGWNIGPRGGDIYSPPALNARPARDGETDNAAALVAQSVAAIKRLAAVKRTSAIVRGLAEAARSQGQRRARRSGAGRRREGRRTQRPAPRRFGEVGAHRPRPGPRRPQRPPLGPGVAVSAATRDDAAHRAIHAEIVAAHAAVMALDPDDESPEAHALGDAQARAVRKIATLPLGGAGAYYVKDDLNDNGMVVRTFRHNRRLVARFEHRPGVLNEGWCIVAKPEEASADREAARAAERERQATYHQALHDLAEFLIKHPHCAVPLAVRVEVGHLYHVPIAVALVHTEGERGGTVSFTGREAVKVSARGLLRRAGRIIPGLTETVSDLRALALDEAVRDSGRRLAMCHEFIVKQPEGDHWFNRARSAERHLATTEADFAAAKKTAGPGWEVRAGDALAAAGATSIIPF